MTRLVITGSSAICGAGQTPAQIVQSLIDGHCAVAPIESWDTATWPSRVASSVKDYNGGKLLGDRKLLKLVRRSDVFGIYAGDQAISQAGLTEFREAATPEDSMEFAEQTGCYVGSGGGAFEVNYDYFPLMADAGDDMGAFGRELSSMVNPMWLLRSLPNNVLCHISIRHQLKGVNGCITNHTTSGALSLIEAAWALREGQARRVVAIAHDAPIEPQTLLYLARLGLVAVDEATPFDRRHSGCVLGEGAGAMVLETEASARERNATVLGEYLGGGDCSEGESLFDVRDDGDGVRRAVLAALADADLDPAAIGLIVAHGNGTAGSDCSEALALRSVFGNSMPPVTSVKWSAGHLFGAAAMLDLVIGLECARQGRVPGIGNFKEIAPGCEGVNVSASTRDVTSKVVLVISRGFGGTNSAVVLRAV